MTTAGEGPGPAHCAFFSLPVGVAMTHGFLRRRAWPVGDEHLVSIRIGIGILPESTVFSVFIIIIAKLSDEGWSRYLKGEKKMHMLYTPLSSM